ncbi:uncharacterized protein TNCT_162711 [Trichonephila clavata]|uniref:Major facilitator superfamily (MFS) profile domain-containing protein n=1 Tax=Trichonephila clavata TaxID=2740835 RepID=A0A8X6LQH3_TRICU|nr:uncharacterized protein TNCT_162711 [Trichonephila clavata]
MSQIRQKCRLGGLERRGLLFVRMLASIEEGLEEDVERPDSAMQRLNIADSKKRTLPEFVGGHGPWQFRQWLIFFVASICNSLYLFSTFPLSARVDCKCGSILNSSSLEMSFINSVTNCTVPNCDTELVKMHNLEANISCANSYQKFINIDQDSVHCSYMKLVIYAKCIYMLGILLSGVSSHLLAFKFGRRGVAFVSGVLLVCCSFGIGVSGSLANFLVMRLIISLTATNIYLVSIYSLIEFVGEEYRMLYGLTGHLGWGLSHFILPLIVWLTHDWMTYSVVISCTSVPLIIISFFIPESVEASIAKGLKAHSQKLIRIAAWKNGYSTDDIEEFTQALGHKDKQEEMKTVWKKGKIKRAFELTLLYLVGFSASFLYFTSLGLTDWMTRDRGGYFALAGTTEIAAVIILLFFMCFFSPKTLWSAATVLASVSFLIMYARSEHEFVHISTGSFLLATFFSSLSWTVVLLSMLFQPVTTTVTKCNVFISAVAICSGTLIASFNDFQKFHSWNPKFFVIYAIPNLTIGASIAILPERYFKF